MVFLWFSHFPMVFLWFFLYREDSGPPSATPSGFTSRRRPRTSAEGPTTTVARKFRNGKTVNFRHGQRQVGHRCSIVSDVFIALISLILYYIYIFVFWKMLWMLPYHQNLWYHELLLFDYLCFCTIKQFSSNKPEIDEIVTILRGLNVDGRKQGALQTPLVGGIPTPLKIWKSVGMI